MSKSNVIAGLRHQLREAQKLIGQVHAVLDGEEWTADTAPAIAELLEQHGLTIRSVDECDCDDRSWHGVEHDSACPLAGLHKE